MKRSLHDVFVSYSTRDYSVAAAIVSRLEQAGVRCWVAPRDVVPGMVWDKAIVQAIEASRRMVVVLSGESNQSREVLREVERAVANGVVVVPFRIESVQPTGAMAYYLAHRPWVDAVSPPLESHIERLVQRLLFTLRPPGWWEQVAPSPPPPSTPLPADRSPGAARTPLVARTPLPSVATISALALVAAFLVLALLR